MTDMTAAGQSVEFIGRRKPLFWLLIKNGLLTILTLGIYRFWAKTHLRRYYWNNITIAGDSLEYLGRPIELLIGFLIAIAILLPLAIAVGVLSFALAAISPVLEPLSSVAFFIVLAWIGSFAIYRVRRYRMTRTSWRGIRAGQTGSAVKYAFMRLGLTVVSLLSFGLAYPWGRVVLHRYVINNTWFGDTSLTFTGTVRQLFLKWIPVQVLFFIFVAIVALSAPTFMGVVQQLIDLQFATINCSLGEQEIASKTEQLGFALLAVAWPLVPVYLAVIVAFIWFRVAELRYLFSNMTLANAIATSTFSFRSLIWRSILLWLALLGVATLIGAAFGVSALAGVVSPALAFLLGLVLVLPIGLTLFTLQHLIFWMPLLRKFCERLSVNNVHELERIAQTTKPDPKYGEGLADALSIDAFPL